VARACSEFVFDQSWASAYARYGERYYPKLQSCVPFTPVTGPRLLVRPGAPADTGANLAHGVAAVADTLGVSSAHVTFPTAAEAELLVQQGWMMRTGLQYHWTNRGYETFADFEAALTQKRRKVVRQERKKAREGLVLRRLRGADITAKHWDAFYAFYCDTAEKKWGQAYLTREFFAGLGDAVGDAVMLMVAEEAEPGGGGEIVAGALNLVGSHALFGRNWGCRGERPFLHMELCYYQAIEEAIAMKLSRVEAGAQGEHKMQRGYLPTTTYSAHYIRSPEFCVPIADFLRREALQMAEVAEELRATSPYKADGAGADA
jgi:predicted N-acyltransferase